MAPASFEQVAGFDVATQRVGAGGLSVAVGHHRRARGAVMERGASDALGTTHGVAMTETAGRVTCMRTSIFGEGLTAGSAYALLAYDPERDRVRVTNDQGRSRWYPADCFARIGATSPQLASFTLDDPITDPAHDCVEVTVQLADGRRRWCFFVTARWLLGAVSGAVEPKPIEKDGFRLAQLTYLGSSLTACDGTTFGVVHVPHMIVVSELSEPIVAEALGHLAGQGDLERCTRPVDEPEGTGGAEGRPQGALPLGPGPSKPGGIATRPTLPTS